MTPNRIPLAARLAGLWILWATWCQGCGWGLSAIHQLSGWGYLAALPVLLAAGWWWMKATADGHHICQPAGFYRQRRRFTRPLPLIYLLIAVLSLVAGLLYPPWSFDAISYRLPRILYWWSAHHWYWIGTIDHRLDFSSCGFEWQMLPVLLLTRSDRCLFLLNWIPFVLMPGLVFGALRSLGVGGRSARRWMWLLPAGFCYALQCSGIQNDGYMVLYTLAVIIFAGLAFRQRRSLFLWLALLAVALLTSAKLSNLPLLMPLGLLLLPALRGVKWINFKTGLVVVIAAGCSFLPLAFLCWQHTGSWTGDPGDQWSAQPRSKAGAFTANAIAFGTDAAQPPVFPIAKKVNARLEPFNQSDFVRWLNWAHPNSDGVHFGNLAYEGSAGLGMGVGLYLLFLLSGSRLVKLTRRESAPALPWEWRLAPWTTWVALAIIMAQIAFTHVTRYAASYYPLLLVSLLTLPRVAALERRKFTGWLAGLAMLAVVPVVLLTPARPVIPFEALAQRFPRPALKSMAASYHYWAVMRDDLAPLRDHLPPDATRIGHACGFRDTSYGLWKPFGSRVVVELGLPLGSKKLPPPDIQYAVATANGLKERYQMSLAEWLAATQGEVVYEMPRNISLVSSDPAAHDTWYLIRFAR